MAFADWLANNNRASDLLACQSSIFLQLFMLLFPHIEDDTSESINDEQLV